MKRILFFAISLIFALNISQIYSQGVTASVDFALFEEAKDAFLEEILAQVNGLQISNQPINGGYFNNNSISIEERPKDMHFTVEGDVVYLTI